MVCCYSSLNRLIQVHISPVFFFFLSFKLLPICVREVSKITKVVPRPKEGEIVEKAWVSNIGKLDNLSPIKNWPCIYEMCLECPKVLQY